MSSRIVGELEFFVRAFAWGISMTLLYDGLRLFRHMLPHGTALTALEDLCYWTIYSLLLFRMMYLENDGMIRGFALLAVLLGMLLYLQIRKILFFMEKKLQNKVKTYIMDKKRKNR